MLAIFQKQKNISSLNLYLGRNKFATGRNLSGVVVFRSNKPAKIRSLMVSVIGVEEPEEIQNCKKTASKTSFFRRDVLLSGCELPRLISDRIALYWNSFLGRNNGRVLSVGEHTYPFSIPLPASIPPSYNGSAGTIEYKVIAKVQYVLGGSQQVSKIASVVFVPRILRGRPMAISYPNTSGTVHDSEVKINLELPQHSIELGSTICGHFSILNPNSVDIPEAKISLEYCEWVKCMSEKGMQRNCADICVVKLNEPRADKIESDFTLSVPDDVPPSIEGTAISVMWMLKLNLGTNPPVEFKTSLVVYAPVDKIIKTVD